MKKFLVYVLAILVLPVLSVYAIDYSSVTGAFIMNGEGDIVTNGNAALMPTLTDMSGFRSYGWDVMEDVSIVYDATGDMVGYFQLDAYGAVYPFGQAYKPLAATLYFGWDIARDIEAIGTGSYYIFDGYGGIHGLGEAAISWTRLQTAYWGWDIGKDLELVYDANGEVSGCMVLDGYGGVHEMGTAKKFANKPYFGWDIARDLEITPNGLGYYLLDGYGGVHTAGNANKVWPKGPKHPAYYFGVDMVRDFQIVTNKATGGVVGLALLVEDGSVSKAGAADDYDWLIGTIFSNNLARDFELISAAQ